MGACRHHCPSMRCRRRSPSTTTQPINAIDQPNRIDDPSNQPINQPINQPTDQPINPTEAADRTTARNRHTITRPHDRGRHKISNPRTVTIEKRTGRFGRARRNTYSSYPHPCHPLPTQPLHLKVLWVAVRALHIVSVPSSAQGGSGATSAPRLGIPMTPAHSIPAERLTGRIPL